MPPPGFITEDELTDQVQATLQLAEIDPAGGWPRTVQAANRAAYGTILRALMRRGFSLEQADQWDDGREFQTDIGLWFAILRGGLSKDYDPKYLEMFDRRPELATATITINGVIVTPAVTASSSGALDTTSDLFSLSDEDLQDWYESFQGPVVPPLPRG
jgi:hypothetical protein